MDVSRGHSLALTVVSQATPPGHLLCPLAEPLLYRPAWPPLPDPPRG